MDSPLTIWGWAKLGNNRWPDVYHPVLCHLLDVGAVAAALWRQVVRPPLRQRLAGSLGLSEADAGRWLAFWAAAHDIGKLTPGFQFQGSPDQTGRLRERLRRAGFRTDVLGNRHHTQTGTRVLADELARGGEGWNPVPGPTAARIALAVGGHHGTFPADWQATLTALGCDRWAAGRRAVLGHLARAFGVPGLPSPLPPPDADQAVWVYLAGLTAVADWVGSNRAFFPPAGSSAVADATEVDVGDWFRTATDRADAALAALGWRSRPDPAGGPVSFADATGVGTPRPLQQAVIPVAEALAAAGRPGLLVVEAPMGEGKTEAAWYAAACWDRCGGQGTYVALPTMATSNQMFDRVGAFLGRGAGRSNLMLLHGKAALNERFADLRYAAEAHDRDAGGPGVVAEGWFAANKKHGLLAPFGVGTIDQALLAVLQTPHGFVRLFGLAGKCVVLDEVHAYDAYMTTLLGRLLRWLAALGCPVVLLSATLPADRRRELVRAYAGRDDLELPAAAYPRLTAYRPDAVVPVSVEPFLADSTRRVEIRLDRVEDGDLAEKVCEAVARGGCVAVVRNTVGLAQETYLRLKAALAGSGVEVGLFHARFPFGRRQEIETHVLDRFGKGADGRPENPLRPPQAVLVATQVIEQSLDLDFDAMFTDLAPADLVLQRAGRLWRHPRTGRPCNAPRLALIETGLREDGRPDFGKSEYVYARYVLLRSLYALRERDSITLPDDLERRVEQVYGTEPLAVPHEAAADLAESETALKAEKRAQLLKARGVMIWPPEMEELLEQPNQQLREDDTAANRKVQAATRDTEPTVSLVLAYHLDGRDYLDPEGAEPFDETEEPSVTRTRRLVLNEVTVSDRRCVAWYTGQPVPSGWRKCGLLQHHRLVRLGPGGRGLAGSEFDIRYEPELGILLN